MRRPLLDHLKEPGLRVHIKNHERRLRDIELAPVRFRPTQVVPPVRNRVVAPTPAPVLTLFPYAVAGIYIDAAGVPATTIAASTWSPIDTIGQADGAPGVGNAPPVLTAIQPSTAFTHRLADGRPSSGGDTPPFTTHPAAIHNHPTILYSVLSYIAGGAPSVPTPAFSETLTQLATVTFDGGQGRVTLFLVHDPPDGTVTWNFAEPQDLLIFLEQSSDEILALASSETPSGTGTSITVEPTSGPAGGWTMDSSVPWGAILVELRRI